MRHIEIHPLPEPAMFRMTCRIRDLSGTVRIHVARLPATAVAALEIGGYLLVRLREDALPEMACWQLLAVDPHGVEIHASYLSDDRLALLQEGSCAWPVRIENAATAPRRRSLLRARHAAQAAEIVLEQARATLAHLETQMAGT